MKAPLCGVVAALCAIVGCRDDAPFADGGSGGSDEDTGATGDPGTTGSSGDTTTGGETGGTGDPSEPIDWQPCSFYTGGPGLEAQCTTFEVPLDWSEPDGESIDLFVKRVGADDGRVQLHMLFGGPGGSGVGFEDDAEDLLAQRPDLEIYLIDHRGTGRSSPLLDLDQAQDQWGAGLDQFNTSNAARDLGWLIDRTRAPGKDAHVYGASYGSYWAHRYLQLFPDQADGVTMLGIAAPGFNFNTWELDFNAAGLQVLELCDSDPVCAARLGPDAVARAFQILVDVSGGHCAAAGLNIPTLRSFFASRVAWHWEQRALVPAILHRLERCNAADVAALQNAAPQIVDALTFSTEPPDFSAVLGNHIRLSELTDVPIPSDAEFEAISNSSIFTLGSLVGMGAAHAAWPRYTPDELDGAYAETNIPMLMLHGEFDPNAPLAQALPMGDMFNGPNQHFFVIPHGVHAFPSPYPGGPSCMQQLFLEFMDDPTAAPDDCTDEVFAMDYDQDQLAPGFFGTASLWD